MSKKWSQSTINKITNLFIDGIQIENWETENGVVYRNDIFEPGLNSFDLIRLFNEFNQTNIPEEVLSTKKGYLRDKLNKLNKENKVLDFLNYYYNQPHWFTEKSEILYKILKELKTYLKYEGVEFELDERQIKFYIKDNNDKIQIENLSCFDSKFLDEIYNDIFEHYKESKYKDSITKCRALIENVFENIYFKIVDKEIDCKGDLVAMWKKIKEILNMQIESGMDEEIKKLIAALSSIVNPLATISNNMSFRHTPKYQPQKHHCKLVINSTFTLLEFIIDSAKFQKLI